MIVEYVAMRRSPLTADSNSETGVVKVADVSTSMPRLDQHVWFSKTDWSIPQRGCNV